MKNNTHNISLSGQVNTVLVLLNAVALRDEYLRESSHGYTGIAFFFLATFAICCAVRQQRRATRLMERRFL